MSDITVRPARHSLSRLWVEEKVGADVAFTLGPALHNEGHPPGSTYVRSFWLPRVGPSALLVWERLVEYSCHGLTSVAVAHLAEAVGIGHVGTEAKHAPIRKTLTRMLGFGMGRTEGDQLLVYPELATLAPHNVAHLPEWLQIAHRHYLDARRERDQASGQFDELRPKEGPDGGV